MSRGQETEVNTTAGNQNATFNQNAQGSYNQAQGDIGNYQSQLSQFAAANPYGQGGAYQTAVNQSTANTADAASQAAAQQAQGAAVRTGQNASGGVAAGQAANEANTRNLMAQQAQNNASRISQGAAYNAEALKASEVPATLEANLSGQQAGAGNTALGTQQKAAETPSLGEELMGGVLSAGSAFAGGFGGGLGKSACWIAAELYGGWNEPRTELVRLWLNQVFRKRWYGGLVMAAYKRWGERVAAGLKKPRHILWRNAFRTLFDAALAEAEVWLATVDGRCAVERNNADSLSLRFKLTPEMTHGDR
jgi:hypothetical protein